MYREEIMARMITMLAAEVWNLTQGNACKNYAAHVENAEEMLLNVQTIAEKEVRESAYAHQETLVQSSAKRVRSKLGIEFENVT